MGPNQKSDRFSQLRCIAGGKVQKVKVAAGFTGDPTGSNKLIYVNGSSESKEEKQCVR